MAQHKKPRGRGGFTGFLRRLFSIRTGALGSAASAAEPLHVESDPSQPKRKGPSHR
ncbi:MAG TPA: hypothetical protein VGG16_16935 [Streptosporangiaceae bacterium]